MIDEIGRQEETPAQFVVSMWKHRTDRVWWYNLYSRTGLLVHPV